MACIRKKTEVRLKRKNILLCPYFRLAQWEYKKGKFAIDMHCSLDGMIFVSQKFENGISTKDVKSMKSMMKETCAMECPKIWSEYPSESEIAEYYEDYIIEDDMILQKFDDDFHFEADSAGEKSFLPARIEDIQTCLPNPAAGGEKVQCQTKVESEPPF
jgi:hypothetical protein